MKIIQCTEQHLPRAAELFNHYRMFYEQDSDLAGSLAFIQSNIDNHRSKIFLLFDDEDEAVGFSQLYPTYCSIAMKPYYYLSDLYIEPSRRQAGHARRLMHFITEHCRAEGAQRLTLDTAATNKIAQHLYQSLGYEQERLYITYHQMLAAP